MLTGIVFEIERFAIEDGAGIRTVIFLKGCPLSCIWCCNPESKDPGPQVAYLKSNCIYCGKCTEVCPKEAISFVEGEGFVIDRNRCDKCGLCTEACVANSKVVIGKPMTVEQVLSEIKKDSLFYHHSSGGVTISGGEPTFQGEFLIELLKRCQGLGFDTAIETCGYTSWGNLQAITKYCNMIFYDLKHMDNEAHKRLTGVSNELILRNLERLSRLSKPIVIRIPLIPGHNDSIDNVKAAIDFIKKLENIQGLEVLPYHRLGQPKYDRLDIRCELRDLPPLDRKNLAYLIKLGETNGVTVKIGG